MDKPYVKRYGKQDSYTVFLVDGAWIRSNKDIEFTNYDQHFHKKYIPKKEVWVDVGAKEGEIPYWAKSGVTEAEKMKRGASYDKAEQAADDEEQKSRRTDSDLHARIREEHLGKVGKINVWLVNGRAIRDTSDVDFTEGGHDQVYKWIPKDTIYLDDDTDDEELPFVFLHELFERNKMAQGMSYEKAHHLASAIELKARRKPKSLMKFLGPELKKAGMSNRAVMAFDLFDGVTDGKEVDTKSNF